MSLVRHPANPELHLRGNPARLLEVLPNLLAEGPTGLRSLVVSPSPAFLAPGIESGIPSRLIMVKVKSFRRRILLALLGVGLVPSALLLAGGTLAIRSSVSMIGTAGPWDQLAESGQVLLERLDSAGVSDPAVLDAAAVHKEALSGSLRFSRMVSFLGERFLGFLPLVSLGIALLTLILSVWVARQLSGGFSRPINDLVGWTQIVARGDPLPPPGPADTRGVQEFRQLRNALRDMAAGLEEGRRQTIQATKLRSWTDMARRVAHELKNPLTPMRMAATSVSRLEGEVAREAASVLLDEIDRLDEMARTFSQFGRMPEGPPSDVDLLELLGMLVRQLQESGSALVLDAPAELPLVRGHYDAILRCFRNILLNAIEATGLEGVVEIRARAMEDGVRVEVRDKGPGIPEADLERIWEPDFSTKSRGTGLGLAMVKQTILAHHGTVEGRNHPEGGAVFVVELPSRNPEREDGAAAGPSSSEPKGRWSP